MFERRFGESLPWSVGIEEELFVLDPVTLAPAAAPDELFDGSRRKRELFRSFLELTTPVCASTEEAAAELAALRRDAQARVETAGLRLLAAGTHPLARPKDQQVTDDPAMQRFAEYAGPSASVQSCCGLHVHVGVPTAAACLVALESLLPWVPLLLALSANSPFFDGRETHMASTRAEILTRLPRSGFPPVFQTLDEWEAFARRLVELGLADDYTRIWWDVRPHPRYGTLELRMPDQPTDPALSGAFAALAQALVTSARPGPPASRAVLAENRWAAARFGTDARLIHPDGSRLVDVPELTDELLDRLRPVTDRLGSARLLEPLRRLATRSQAQEQLELARTHGLRGLVERLVARTSLSGD